MTEAKLRQLSKLFTSIFKAYLPHGAPFPDGNCGTASYVLGHVLRIHCGLETMLVAGTQCKDQCGLVRCACSKQRHCWLEYILNDEVWIIDLTARQFRDDPRFRFPGECPFVGRISNWHSKWGPDRNPISHAPADNPEMISDIVTLLRDAEND